MQFYIAFLPSLRTEKGSFNQGSSFWGCKIPLGVHFLYLKSNENWQWLVAVYKHARPSQAKGASPRILVEESETGFWVEEVDPQRNFWVSKWATLDNCAHLWLRIPDKSRSITFAVGGITLTLHKFDFDELAFLSDEILWRSWPYLERKTSHKYNSTLLRMLRSQKFW